MSDEELLGAHTRLRKELSVAYAEPFWDTVRIRSRNSPDGVQSRWHRGARSGSRRSPPGRQTCRG